MINQDTLYAKALLKLLEVYNMEYLKPIVREMWIGKQKVEDAVRFYFSFESEDDRPNLTPNYKGWTVYATVDVNMKTGEATLVDYVLPDGTKMKK